MKLIIQKIINRLNFIKSKRMFSEFGFGSVVIKPLRIANPDRIQIKSNVHIGDGSIISCYKKGSVSIGSNVWATRSLNLWAGENIIIDDDVLIGSYCLITDMIHGIDAEAEERYQLQDFTSKPVHIESGCWIGDKASILPGVRIGKKSIIGANSVVTKDIPAYSMAVGNPAKVVKQWSFETHQWEKV